MQGQVDAAGDGPKNIKIAPNFSSFKSEVILKGGYRVDFKAANSVRNVLGFTDVTTAGLCFKQFSTRATTK